MLNWFTCFGGGAGDVWREFLLDQTSHFIPHLVRDLDHKVRVYTLCHCSAVEDLFRYHPYISEHICEPWAPPSREEAIRFSNPIDGFLPLQNYAFVRHHLGYDPPMEPTQFYLSQTEHSRLGALLSQRPLIVMQPYAGLSDRDGFDPDAIERTVNDLVRLDRNVRIVVVGKNHDRGHKYSQELCTEATNSHPNVTNL